MSTDGTAASSILTMTAALPAGAAGRWCAVSVHWRGGGAWWAQLELTDEARGQVVRDCFLGALRWGGTRRRTLVHVPAGAAEMVLRIYAGAIDAGAGGHPDGHADGHAVRQAGGQPGQQPVQQPGQQPVLRVRVLSRVGAALRLLWHGRGLIRRSLAGDARGRLGRLRAVLGQAPARAGQAPPYAAWIALYEPRLPPPGAAPALDCMIAVAGVDGPGLQASLASLRAQSLPPGRVLPVLRVQTAGDWAGMTAPWGVLVQAGEVLAPDALAWFAAAAAAQPDARFITGDCDRLAADGGRSDPLFKPGPDTVLLRSGLLAAGACAVRFDAAPVDLPADADAARRRLALRHAGAMVRVPRILTHIGGAAWPAAYAAPASARPADFAPRVTALVPSAVRSAHVPRCLRAVVSATDYPAFGVDLVLSGADGADPLLLREISELPLVRVSKLDVPAFNYAAVNNRAALCADGELLLLLNDDVAPLRTDWLSAMVAHMQDPRVGIVGARLLYGNGMVQHEGVVMGLAHLCEHAGRLRAGNDAGPHGLGLLDREVCAVTAACLLIRADLYRALGGMDESFAIALNDVDLCLRARRAGWKVVYCAQAVLWHYESLSLGRHYEGARAALEAREVRRLRALWPDAIACDPFYNPAASLEPGREWQPGFPPRVPGLAGWAANPAATG